MKIVVLNAGSSSQKSKLYELAEDLPERPPRPLWEAEADWAEHPGETDLKVRTVHGETAAETLPSQERSQVLHEVQKQARQAALAAVKPVLTAFLQAEQQAKLGRERRYEA